MQKKILFLFLFVLAESGLASPFNVKDVKTTSNQCIATTAIGDESVIMTSSKSALSWRLSCDKMQTCHF